MLYCTKELYQTMQETDYHLLLKVNKKAETFDEEFYRRLYARKLDERLALDRGLADVTFDEIFHEQDFQDIEAKAFFEQARREWKPKVFDEEKTKRSFAAQHRNRIRLLKTSLPRDILEKTADVRVLALDTASAEVKRLITAFCKENERKVNRAIKELQKAEKRDFGEEPPEFCRESLHDSEILSCRMKGKDLVIELDSGGFTTACGAVFKNAEIVLREGRLAGAIWLYDEVYKCERGLEIHALLQNGSELKYLTVRCEDAELVF